MKDSIRCIWWVITHPRAAWSWVMGGWLLDSAFREAEQSLDRVGESMDLALQRAQRAKANTDRNLN